MFSTLEPLSSHSKREGVGSGGSPSSRISSPGQPWLYAFLFTGIGDIPHWENVTVLGGNSPPLMCYMNYMQVWAFLLAFAQGRLLWAIFMGLSHECGSWACFFMSFTKFWSTGFVYVPFFPPRRNSHWPFSWTLGLYHLTRLSNLISLSFEPCSRDLFREQKSWAHLIKVAHGSFKKKKTIHVFRVMCIKMPFPIAWPINIFFHLRISI